MAFVIAVDSYYLHPDPDLTETMALVSTTKARHWPGIDMMKAALCSVLGEAEERVARRNLLAR